MFSWLFIKKANFERIKGILEKERFVFYSGDIHSLLLGNQKGTRYGNIVLTRNEDGKKERRFLKIMLDGKWKTFQPFQRQVKIADALHTDFYFHSPTIAVINSFLKPPVPYAIFETRDDGQGFGFMHDKPIFYESFSEQEMHELVQTLYSFHRAGFEINRRTLQYTRKISDDIFEYKNEFQKIFSKRIKHKNTDGVISENTVEEFLKSYTGVPDIGKRIITVLEDNWNYVLSSEESGKTYLVHADMQIDNIYKHKDGSFELLDFEWVGRSHSPLIAIMYDYGNLRARAWSSPPFQELLDKIMVVIGKKYYEDTWVKAGLKLGTIRSSLIMSRYHLDFANTVAKDRRTEDEYHTMYPKTIASLKKGLS